jgi:hypothetical protein
MPRMMERQGADAAPRTDGPPGTTPAAARGSRLSPSGGLSRNEAKDVTHLCLRLPVLRLQLPRCRRPVRQRPACSWRRLPARKKRHECRKWEGKRSNGCGNCGSVVWATQEDGGVRCGTLNRRVAPQNPASRQAPTAPKPARQLPLAQQRSAARCRPAGRWPGPRHHPGGGPLPLRRHAAGRGRGL